MLYFNSVYQVNTEFMHQYELQNLCFFLYYQTVPRILGKKDSLITVHYQVI